MRYQTRQKDCKKETGDKEGATICSDIGRDIGFIKKIGKEEIGGWPLQIFAGRWEIFAISDI